MLQQILHFKNCQYKGLFNCQTRSTTATPVLHQSTVPCMDSFRLLSDEEVSVIVRKSPTKTCEADPIPTTLLKDILPNIVPLLREIVNKSLQTGTFPDDLKVALVRTL